MSALDRMINEDPFLRGLDARATAGSVDSHVASPVLATPTVATPAAFASGVAFGSAIVMAFDAGRNAG
jgi:hypothetical protein